MCSLLVKLSDKSLIVIIRLAGRLILKLLISLTTDFTDSFRKFTKQLSLLRLPDRVSSKEFPANIRRRYDIDTTLEYSMYNIS